MIPAVFRARRAIENLNIAAVGLALGAMTAVAFSVLFNQDKMAWFTGPTTMLLGALWARLLRWPKTVGNTRLRTGWLLSIPLAALNASLAAALMLGFDGSHFDPGSFFGGLVAGPIFGVVVWVPALILTLLFFGVPVAWSQRLAQKGLAGQERGEMVVGATSFLIAMLALVGATQRHAMQKPTGGSSLWLIGAMSVAGMFCAFVAVISSAGRAARRRAFVAEVEAGRVERFRVDVTDEGKALVRVVSQGQGYRVADLEEEIAVMDREGNVLRAQRGDGDD